MRKIDNKKENEEISEDEKEIYLIGIIVQWPWLGG